MTERVDVVALAVALGKLDVVDVAARAGVPASGGTGDRAGRRGEPVIRPGPARIPPDQAPGGVVVHGYSILDQALLFVQPIPEGRSSKDVAFLAELNADIADATGVPGTCLVAYDGDTGERMSWTDGP